MSRLPAPLIVVLRAHQRAFLGGRRRLGPSVARWRMTAVLVAVVGAAAVPAYLTAQEQDARPGAPDRSIGREALNEARKRFPGDAGIDLKHGLAVARGTAECPEGQVCFACSQCHRVEGEGEPTLPTPRLSGQAFQYLYDSLHDFASGARKSEIMQPVAKALTDKDMRDVAAYFAAQPPDGKAMAKVAAQKHDPKPEVLAEGGKIAAVGIAERGVQGCQNCHGPEGAGLPPVYPYLAGQYAEYLEAQLKAWKSGERGGDPLDIMREIAKRMTDEQIHAVAQYYAAIRPPRVLPQGTYTVQPRGGGGRASGNEDPQPEWLR